MSASNRSNDGEPQNDAALRRMYEEASRPFHSSVKVQLAYRHMIALADMFEGWAIDRRTTRDWTAKLVGMAEAMRNLADDVGPLWDPPEPRWLTLLGFLARRALHEPTRGRTPADRSKDP